MDIIHSYVRRPSQRRKRIKKPMFPFNEAKEKSEKKRRKWERRWWKKRRRGGGGGGGGGGG